MPFDPGSNTVVDPISAGVHALRRTFWSTLFRSSSANYPKLLNLTWLH